MVATPMYKLDAPVTIKIEGKDKMFSTHDAIMDALRALERSEIGLNRQAALAAFHLGRALIDTAKALGYGHLNHLYNQAGINGRRAERAIRFAKHYSDEQGGFDLDKYRDGELKARNRHQTGESKCTFDGDGKPSLLAVQRAEGLHPDSKAKNATSDTSVGTRNQTNTRPFSAKGMLDALASDQQQPHTHRQSASIAGDTIGDKTWAAGEQMVIDFDLVATERRLAAVIDQADRAYKDGAMSETRAVAINEAVDRLADEISEQINQDNQTPRS